MAYRSLFLLLFLFVSHLGTSQSYLDIFSASYGYGPNAGYEDGPEETGIHSADITLLLPVPTRKGPVLITGLNFFVNRLRPDPGSPENISFYALAPRLGLQFDYGKGWTGTHVLIPRLSTAFSNARNGLQIAALQLFQKQKPSGNSFSLGFYSSRESYGWMLVPIFGGYFSGANGAWELRLFLPAQGDLNFRLAEQLRAGLVFDGLGSTHDFENVQFGRAYVQRIANDLQGYLQINLGKSVLLAARAGYSFFRSYRVYEAGDTAGVSIANIFFRDDRTPLNSSVSGGFICSVRMAYRFHLQN